MPNSTKASADEVLYKQLKYRAVSPLEHQLECLDVVTKVERTWLQRFTSKMSSSLRPLVRQGSMLSEDLMAVESKWRSADGTLDRLRKDLGDLRNSSIKRPADETVFKKKKMQNLDLAWSKSKGASAWVMGICGTDLGKDESLSCTLDGLTSASVDYVTIRSWISAGDWCPNVTTLASCSADWSKDHGSKMKSLWIVTEVLYATKFTLTGRSGLLSRVSAKVSTGIPGLNAGGDLIVMGAKDNAVELKARRNKHFIIGYRTMRVDYNPDGTVLAMKAPGDTGLRGDDDDPYQANLKSMEEDIFEVDEDGDSVPIPLLTPTKEELDDLKQTAANSSDSQGPSSK